MSDEVKGFKFKRFDYVGGTTVADKYDWGSNSTYLTRSQGVLLDIGKFLISDTDLHWQIDTAKHPNYNPSTGLQISDFYDVSVKNSSGTLQTQKYPGLFFTNSESGCKLFLSVIGDSSYYLYVNSNCVSTGYDTNSFSNTFVRGIIASIIPGESNQNFGDFTTLDSFLPSQATRISGTLNQYISTSNKITFIESNTSNYNYVYGIFATDYCIGVGGGYTTNTSIPQIPISFFTGKILGVLANEENTPQARYGCFSLENNAGSSNGEFSGGMPHANFILSDSSAGVSDVDFYGQHSYVKRYKSPISIFDASGNILNSVAGKRVNIFPEGAEKLSINNTQYTISNKLRWVPAAVCVCSDDLSNYCVTAGDGFKGYLDTDLFRYAITTYGNFYGNGQFIGFYWNLLLGWNTSNTDSL